MASNIIKKIRERRAPKFKREILHTFRGAERETEREVDYPSKKHHFAGFLGKSGSYHEFKNSISLYSSILFHFYDFLILNHQRCNV